MSLQARSRHAIFNDTAKIVVLMTVNERVVHTDIGQSTAKQQRVHLQPLEQYFQIGAEKGGIASFPDQIVRYGQGNHPAAVTDRRTSRQAQRYFSDPYAF